MLIKSQKDFFSGLMFAVVGGGFAIGATEYTVGQASRMGPGYFPLILGILLTVLGVLVSAQSFTSQAPDGDKIGKWAWKPLFFVIAANLIFGLLLGGLPSIGFPSFGLIAAIYALVFVASQAGEKVRIKELFVLATILAVGSYLAFIKLLNLQFPVWPAFLVG
ncbi:tripartite tricarboxylate transporter TctB family protein [Hydrogenophaga sp. OTU3427]|uniref:tripartite tricarboxylate transporter TctB family protein n=1 Tax=Hydrogenophaga sp. OTU3427 TaxID=3043856 RepID=UPI00313E47D2